MNTAPSDRTSVDWENPLDMDRLRRERLGRLHKTLEESSLGGLLTASTSPTSAT